MKKYRTSVGRYKYNADTLVEALRYGIAEARKGFPRGGCATVWDMEKNTVIAIVTDDADGITCHRLRPRMNIDIIEAGDWDKISKDISVSR